MQLSFTLKHQEVFGGDGDLTLLLAGLEQYRNKHVMMDRIEKLQEDYMVKVQGGHSGQWGTGLGLGSAGQCLYGFIAVAQCGLCLMQPAGVMPSHTLTHTLHLPFGQRHQGVDPHPKPQAIVPPHLQARALGNAGIPEAPQGEEGSVSLGELEGMLELNEGCKYTDPLQVGGG